MFSDHYIAKKIYSKKSILEIEKKLNLLGVSTKLTVFGFLNLKFIRKVAYYGINFC